MHTFHARYVRHHVTLCIAGAIWAGALILLSAGGCGSSSPSGSASTTSAATEPVSGGVARIAVSAPTTLDPHFASHSSEARISHQIYDWLIVLNDKNEPTPSLATKWEMTPDGKTWTFTVRDDAKFSDGTPLTVDDIIYSFNRMRDPKIGAATVTIFKGIDTIDAPDSTHVVFHLNAANPEFVKDLGDYHAAIISHTVSDPAKEVLGSGAFMVEKYTPSESLVLVKNPYYWGRDEAGRKLPYLDGVTFVMSPDTGAQVDGLLGGQLDYVPDLSVELAQKVEGTPGFKLNVSHSNWGMIVHLRSDPGHLGQDPRLALALRKGTDYQALVDLVRPGFAVVGNGTIVGPSYGDYYLNVKPTYDPEGAKKLLAEAGHAPGYTMKLYVQTGSDMVALATVWKEQMRKIGVTVNIQVVPPNVYYSDSGPAAWLKCDFGLTDWSNRATPVEYFNMSYVTGAPWPESHWSDAEFDKTVAAINSELDPAKRATLYHQAQQILLERGPVVVLAIEDTVAALNGKLMGVTVPLDFNQALFAGAYFAK